MSRNDPQLAAMVNANDKFLKALIILLAMKDEHLLEELGLVFTHMRLKSREMGKGSPDTWEHLRHEMALMTSMVENHVAMEVDGKTH